jgi:hypothetical protein
LIDATQTRAIPIPTFDQRESMDALMRERR